MNKEKRINILLAMAIALVTVLVTASLSSQENPPILMKLIKDKGARWVVWDLWEKDNEWDNVMNRIASGRKAWVDLAIALYPGSDAGAASELHDTMFQALGNNPLYVLRVAEPTYPLSDLCEGRSDPLPTYKEAIAEHEHTIAAVRKVKAKELQTKKETCLGQLKVGEQQLRHFFGISGN